MNSEQKLVSAVTQYDLKQSKKKGHNFNALPQYLARVELIAADIGRGAAPRNAILAGFTGHLADACLKAVGETISTTKECNDGPVCYRPRVAICP